MQKTMIEISANDLRKALPDTAWNAAEDTFLAVWAAAPGMESNSFDYFVSGQKNLQFRRALWAGPSRYSKPAIY